MHTMLAASLLLLSLCGAAVGDWHYPIHRQLVQETLAMENVLDVVDLVTSAHAETRRSRHLQQDPDFICESFEEASNGTLACQCARYDRVDVQIVCNRTAPICNADATTCLNQSVAIIVDEESRVLQTTSCTYFNTTEQPMDTCVQVKPATPNGFNESFVCQASLNDKLCNWCQQCQESEGNITLSFDCCNAVTDAKQTCGYLSPQGATIPQFDAIDSSNQGKCSGEHGSGVSAVSVGATAIFTAVAMVMSVL